MNEDMPLFNEKGYPIILGRLGLIRLLAHGKILDVGCGLGTTFGAGATNLDVLSNEEMIEYVHDTDPELYDWFLKLFPDGKTLNYVQADATKHIPFEDKTFDCAVLSEVIEHLTLEDNVNILRESGRVANFVIISTPNEYEWPKQVAFGKETNPCIQRTGKALWTHHITFHTQETLFKVAKDAGLQGVYYLKVNIMGYSHHILCSSNIPLIVLNHRFGVGYGYGLTNHEFHVTRDEVISCIPPEEKKLNTDTGM